MHRSRIRCHRRGCTPARGGRSGFTLIEMLVVIAIIVVLSGLLLATVGLIQRGQRRTATLSLVQTVALAIESYAVDSIRPPVTSGVTSLRPMWDLDQDFILDPRPDAVAALAVVAPVGYRGFAAALGASLPTWATDAQGHVIDRWRRPLRIDWPGWQTDADKDAAGVGAARGTGSRLYGAAKVGIWSVGADGLDGPPDSPAAADNLRSW